MWESCRAGRERYCPVACLHIQLHTLWLDCIHQLCRWLSQGKQGHRHPFTFHTFIWALGGSRWVKSGGRNLCDASVDESGSLGICWLQCCFFGGHFCTHLQSSTRRCNLPPLATVCVCVFFFFFFSWLRPPMFFFGWPLSAESADGVFNSTSPPFAHL